MIFLAKLLSLLLYEIVFLITKPSKLAEKAVGRLNAH